MTMATPATLGLDPLPAGVDIKISEPLIVEIATADGIFVKQMWIRNAGTFIPQHKHVWDHTSALLRGSCFVWRDGKLDQRYVAPALIFVAKGVAHTFLALEDDTVIYCLHNLHGADKVAVLDDLDLLDEVA